ncbi:membrane protein insertase YidC [Sediminivirga luteola]|uniref:Membrane protein insertase YidC n=1 Tax=Sediminivirga luteola TaxID=1774748 RepID=A0A8J2TZD2_9MICO|nr:membrane protein insertase YidC [Sediminivirga luteola]MCI2266624.1 membrane protein insertase YidC [Sediminivirga luteola]GGA20213.1 membrane protein insertase YidC [Sediminivirga luteola]
MDWIDTILTPIKWVVAWILVLFHQLFEWLGMDPVSGWTWVLAITCLTMVVRTALIPLFVKQIRSQRKMQLIQPDLQRLQAKYKGKKDQFSRQAMAEEQQALFKKHGTNPLSSCLPMLVQLPIFFSLYRVLFNSEDVARGVREPIGGYNAELAGQLINSEIFGIPLHITFLEGDMWVKVFTAVLIVLMGATMFITQKQIMAKNMSEAAMNNPFMQQQKMLLYLMPVVFAVGGVFFPVSLLLYWLVSNLWTMVQQFYVIRQMPAPGSPAEKALMERRAKKGKPPLPGAKPLDEEKPEETPKGQRQQPVSKDRAKKQAKKQSGKKKS